MENIKQIIRRKNKIMVVGNECYELFIKVKNGHKFNKRTKDLKKTLIGG